MADYRKGPISSNLEDKTGEPPAYPGWYMDFIINPLDHMLNRTIGTAARRDANVKWNAMAPNEQSKFINDGLNSLSNLTTNPSVHETTRAPDELSKLYADWLPSAGNFRGHTFNAMMQPRAVDDRPLTFRGAIAPLGTYANPDGTEEAGLAWPGMITEPLNALQRLHENSYTEDGRPGIPNPQHPENLEDASTLLWSIYGGNALNPAAAIPKNAVGMFAGRRAKTADHNALAQAEKMAAEGASRDDIWNRTGWFQGADDKWRFEIDDSQANMNWWTRNGRLKNVLDHDALNDAYPSIGNIQTWQSKGMNALSAGGYSPHGTGVMGKWLKPAQIEYSPIYEALRGPEATASTLLHEAQHAIQQREGFARGAKEREYSMTADKYMDDIHKPDSHFQHAKSAVAPYADAMMERDGLSIKRPNWRDAPDSEMLKRMDEGFAWDDMRAKYEARAYDEINQLAYTKSAGEVEARNVQARKSMTPEQRRATPPWLTQEMPFEQQFLQQHGKRSPLPKTSPKAQSTDGISPAWMEPVHQPAEILPPAPITQTADDALSWLRGKLPPIIDGNLLSDTGKPSLFGSAISSVGHDVSGGGAVTKPDWLEEFLRRQY